MKKTQKQYLRSMLIFALIIYAFIITVLYYLFSNNTIKEEHFIVPRDTTVSLVWENRLNGRKEVSKISATTGDKLLILIDEKERVSHSNKPYVKIKNQDENIVRTTNIKKQLETINSDLIVIEKSKYIFYPSRFDFFFVSPLNTKLVKLRKQENLEKIIAGAGCELELFVRIMKWTREVVAAGTPEPYPPWDALEILKRCREQNLKVFCGQYVQIMVQSLLSMGYNARYVGLSSHEVMEVWSNKLDKWLLFDPYYCCYYKSGKSVLNALEIHDFLHNKQLDRINTVRCVPAIPYRDSEIEQFKGFNVSLYTNQMLTGESGGFSIQNMPWRRVYWVGGFSKEFSISAGSLKLRTNRPNDLYFKLYSIEPFLHKSESGLEISLFANTPNLDTFQYALNDAEWINCNQRFTLHLNKGVYKLRFRAKNQAGRIGQTTFVKFKIVR